MAIQALTVLSKSPAERFWRPRIVYGRAGASGRAVVDQDGVPVQAGGTSFTVPIGSVAPDEVILFAGQHFRIEGIQPIPPYLTRATIETAQVEGQYPQTPSDPFVLLVDDHYLTADDYRLTVL